MAGLGIRELVILGALLAVAVAGAKSALGGRGAESAFLYRQEHPPRLERSDVERLLRSAPDPATGRGRAAAASCRPRGSRGLGNPWRCTLTYRAGGRARVERRVAFTARLGRDGAYVGRYRGGGKAVGCCLNTGGAPR